jgi:hypothetical protein
MRVQKVVTISICAATVAFSSQTWAQQGKSDEFFRQNSGGTALAQNSNDQEDALTRALHQKQAELDAQASSSSSSVPNNAATSSTKANRRSKQVKTEAVHPSQAVKVEPVRASDSNDQLTEALRRKQAELDAQEQAAQVSQAPKAVAPAPAKKSLAEQKAEEKERAESEKRIRKIESEIKAKEAAIQKKMAAQNKAALKENKKQAAQTKHVAPTNNASAPVLQPAPAPNSKQARLDELLRKYMADEITPHEYHLKRAQIIAEP